MRYGMKKSLVVLLSVLSASSFAGDRLLNTVHARLETSPVQAHQQVLAQKFINKTTVLSATSAAITTARVTKIAKHSIATSLVA